MKISKMEQNLDLICKDLLKKKKIKSYEAQPKIYLYKNKTFQKQKLKQLVYTPDFLIKHHDGSLEYIEVKGSWHRNAKGRLVKVHATAFMIRWKLFKRYLLEHHKNDKVMAYILTKDNEKYNEFTINYEKENSTF